MTEAEVLEMTYFDKATIRGKLKYKKSNGTTAFIDDAIKAENIKCAISKKDLPIGEQTDTTNNLSYKVVMFCNSNIDVIVGDKVDVVLESGVNKLYVAGEPFYYKSHLEVPLSVRTRV